MSRYTIAGGNLAELAARFAAVRTKAARTGKLVRIVSCYEAGFDGHWLHRWLTDQGVINHVIDPASIQVSRRARRAKTDRIDLEQLMRALLAFLRASRGCGSMVHVPTVEDEDRKRRNRERDACSRNAPPTPIASRVCCTRKASVTPCRSSQASATPSLICALGMGGPLPQQLKEEIVREHERLCLVNQQLGVLEATAGPRSVPPRQARRKKRPCASLNSRASARSAARTGQRSVLSPLRQSPSGRRLFRAGRNALRQRRTASATGHQQSRQSPRPRTRRRTRLAVDPTQPDSDLTLWFRKRVGDIKGRVRRIAIVAVARKLMVALWRYLETGVVPTGAVLRPSL